MNELYKNILHKRELLNSMSDKLKTEFIGLNTVIEEILNLISPWYFFPDAQLRPTIINIWGLTGTGKTALVKRIIEILEKQENYVHLDMGEFSGETSSWIKTIFTDDLDHFHEKPCILCFDEFQFARTLDNNENELTRDKMRVLWELFDSGKIYYEPSGVSYYVRRAEQAINLISKCLIKEVALVNGEIVSNISEFLAIFNGFYFDNFERYGKDITASYFLSKDFIEGIKELYSSSNFSDADILEMLKSASLTEIAAILNKGIRKEMKVKQLDLTRSLIFILGNLDEAFYMSDELSPDFNADEFYSETLKINIADIKSALKKRFRNEQIARLGNNHIIYPCFNQENYRLFIKRNLNRIAAYVQQTFNISLHFDESVVNVIYDEGVFPSQGVRPVITTVKQMVESYIGQVVCFAIEQKLEAKQIVWNYSMANYDLAYLGDKGEELKHLKISPKLRLNELRKSDNSDLQLHTAVHESGHAIVAALSLRILPSLVVTKTVSSFYDGFCKLNLPEKLMTKSVLRKRIMIALAGYLSEKLIFGEDNTSTGVCGDIERATELANQAIKEYGMGADPIRIHVQTADNNDFFFNKSVFEEQALQLIHECIAETEKLLIRNKLLLLKMSQYLTNNSVIKEQAIGEMVKYYGVEPWLRNEEFLNKGNFYSFKNVVQKQLEELEHIPNKEIEEMFLPVNSKYDLQNA